MVGHLGRASRVKHSQEEFQSSSARQCSFVLTPHVTYARCMITAWSAKQCTQWIWAKEKADSVSCYSTCWLRCYKVRSRLRWIASVRGDAFRLKMIADNGFKPCATWFGGDSKHLNAHVSATIGVWDGDLGMKANYLTGW